MHSFFLLLRTYLSLLVAKLDGVLVRDLVSGNGRGFARGLAYWFALALPSMYTNAMVRRAVRRGRALTINRSDTSNRSSRCRSALV